MVKVGFYKAPGTIYDYIVRWITRSQYSHCEIFEFIGHRCIGYTSSPRDQGVVIREIHFKPEHWDLFDVEWVNEDSVYEFIRERLGQPYDWSSIFLSHLFKLGIHCDGRWICSEILAEALGLDRSWTISPGDLYRIIQDRSTD